MKKLARFLLALALAFSAPVGFASVASAQGSLVGAGNGIICTSMATLAVGSSSLTQIVALDPTGMGRRIVVCGWHITNTGATGTFSFTQGTGTNCASNATLLIPPANVTSTAPSADHIDFATWQTAPGYALCITPSVATISAIVWYAYV
jgi:hypothetical protein